MNDSLIENGMIATSDPSASLIDYEPDRCERCDATRHLDWMVSGGRMCKSCMREGLDIISNLVIKDATDRGVHVDSAVLEIIGYVAGEIA